MSDHRTARIAPRSRRGIAGTILAVALIASACGDDSQNDQTGDAAREFIVEQLVDEIGVSESAATCVVDRALEDYSLEDLSTLNDAEPDPELSGALVEISTECLLADEGFGDLIGNNLGDDGDSTDDDANDDGEDPLTVSTEAFCSSSRQAFESFAVLDYFTTNVAPGAVEVAFAELLTDIAVARGQAPNAELAEAPQAALDHLVRIDAAVSAAGYGGDPFATLHPDDRSDLDGFVEIMGLLERYLMGPCGYDADTVEGDAETRAVELEGLYAGTPPEPESAGVDVVDSLSGIGVRVPAGWTDRAASEAGGTRTLTVAPDVAEYQRTWAADGVAITSTDVAGGIVDSSTPITETAAWNDCELERSRVYDDGEYTGDIHWLGSCGDGATSAVVIGAVDSARTVTVLVEIQMQSLDDLVVDEVLASLAV